MEALRTTGLLSLIFYTSFKITAKLFNESMAKSSLVMWIIVKVKLGNSKVTSKHVQRGLVN